MITSKTFAGDKSSPTKKIKIIMIIINQHTMGHGLRLPSTLSQFSGVLLGLPHSHINTLISSMHLSFIFDARAPYCSI
jgi:hypothetical protein